MDFRFNINNLLPKRINKITHTLIPEGFRGDRREYNDCQRLLTRILDDMGEASAKAQGLNRTITSAQKIRDTDHIIYLLVDNKGNKGLGSIIGLLKTGSKTLFMFDKDGYHYQLKPRCILDFYVHESQQRKGLGNELYEFMLSEENLRPIKLAIDRPSDKFLGFLKKYYGLTEIIPQNNKFVVFKGFFNDETQEPEIKKYDGSYSQPQNNNDIQSVKNMSLTGTPTRSAYGRYAASRPPCSMANIIHHSAAVGQTTESPRSSILKRREVKERPDSLNIRKEENVEKENIDNLDADSIVNEEENIETDSLHGSPQYITALDAADASSLVPLDELTELTLKNVNKRLNEELNDDACSVTSVCSQDGITENHGRTSAGHLDLKFYHAPLW